MSALFRKKASAPHFAAAWRDASSPESETIMTFVPPWLSLRRRVASNPSTPGISRFMRTTSGLSCLDKLTASSPSTASPTTSTSLSFASSLRMKLRYICSSSAIKTFTVLLPPVCLTSPRPPAAKANTHTSLVEAQGFSNPVSMGNGSRGNCRRVLWGNHLTPALFHLAPQGPGRGHNRTPCAAKRLIKSHFSGLDYAPSNGVTDEAGGFVDAQLLHDPRAVSLGGLDADDQQSGDLFCALPFGDQL